MRTEDIKKARELRSQGASIKDIAKTLKASRGSVSLWVRDIILTEEQRKTLVVKMKKFNSYEKIQKLNLRRSQISKEKRESWRSEGYNIAKEKNWLFLIGVSLYWAEGTKKNNWNSVLFSNSDIDMLKLFIKFIEQSLNIDRNRITVYINCYTDLHTMKEIENYWLENLGVKRENLRKTMVNKISKVTQNKRKNLLEWGTCKLAVHDTSAIQKIYGAIENFKDIAAVI